VYCITADRITKEEEAAAVSEAEKMLEETANHETFRVVEKGKGTL